MGVEALGWAALAMAAAGAGAQSYNSARQRSQARDAARKQEDAAKKQLAAEDEANNRANQKQADIEGLLSAADSTGAMGGGSNLTGAGGAPAGASSLGKTNTLG